MSDFPESTYIANKMRGIELYNFPWFDRAVKFLESLGVEATSPADLDRAEGFSEYAEAFEGTELEHAVRRDVEAIILTEAVSVGPEWQDSRGARAEAAIAEWVGRGLWYVDPDARIYVPLNDAISQGF